MFGIKFTYNKVICIVSIMMLTENLLELFSRKKKNGKEKSIQFGNGGR